ncbi:hypothetical protein G5C60_28095 [Streptomyces sp. HC44]|uniref:HTH hxlR-type domain-containing protein n=1 Tax=Streptomyces scabichelini TaxID=2711217 RepID=A0A6G4VBL7_9ACTN|nr:winged helix-turn-helix transcriptional regulator [Streptomyces scabichelini]NGO11361.1 hypothetical protein [Streptomyces scabichelini]
MGPLPDWWTPLVLSEAIYRIRRFDEFRDSLEIARNPLTNRLRRLVEEGRAQSPDTDQCDNPRRGDRIDPFRTLVPTPVGLDDGVLLRAPAARLRKRGR